MRSQITQANTSRQSNIELLRIIAMLGVVILHYNSVGGGFDHVPQGGVSMWLLYGLEGLFIGCVNLFVLITGFFSCTQQSRKLGKALALFLQVSVFQLLAFCIRLLRGQTWSFRALLISLIPNNYFVSLYVALYFLSPYLNILLGKLSQTGIRRLLITSLVLFSLWPTATECLDSLLPENFPGLSSISLSGSLNGYSIVNFVLMYLAGASLRLLDIRVKKRYSGPVLILTALVLALWGHFDTTTGMARAYCNPLVILEAIAAFLFVRQLQFHSKLVNALSAGAFTCFLLHSALLDFYQIPKAVVKPAIFVAGHIIFTATSIYLISYVAFRVYNIISAPLIRTLNRLPERKSTAVQQEE